MDYEKIKQTTIKILVLLDSADSDPATDLAVVADVLARILAEVKADRHGNRKHRTPLDLSKRH